MSDMLKSVIVSLLIASVIVLSFPSNIPTARAQFSTDTLIGGLSCTAAGGLVNWLQQKIATTLQKLGFGLINRGFSWLGIAIADAVPINDENNDTREGFLDIAARCFAREIMNDLGARMIGAVRTSGRGDGRVYGGRATPSFIQNWRKFLLDSQSRGEDIFRSILRNTTEMCDHVKGPLYSVYGANNQVALDNNPIRVGSLDPYTRRGACTLPRGWSLQDFSRDFAGNGGWEALLKLAEPQNNFLGGLLMADGELSAQRGQTQLEDMLEAMTGGGFTGRRGKPGDACAVYGQRGCIIYKDILTPGSVLGDTASNVIKSELEWIGNVDEWQEIIQYAMRTVMTRVLDLSKPTGYDQETIPAETPGSYYQGDNFNENNLNWNNLPPATPLPLPQCNDGLDNDGNNLADYPNDPGCSALNDPTEGGGGTSSVELCSEVNFGGTCETFSSSDLSLVDNPVGNDQSASLRVPSGFTVTLCSDINLTGICQNFTSDDSDLGDNGFIKNAATGVSSISISGGGSGGFCGDGICDSTEDEFICPQDCGPLAN